MERRHWLDERYYADLVALCQFLPGPASSQFGIEIGLAKAGLPGAFAAWLGFNLPSALALIIVGYGILEFQETIPIGFLHGLKVVAVAVVVQAVWGMVRTLCPDTPRITLAVIATVVVIVSPIPIMHVAVISVGGIVGLIFLQSDMEKKDSSLAIEISRSVSIAAIAFFFALLIGLPLIAAAFPSQGLPLIDSFYRPARWYLMVSTSCCLCFSPKLYLADGYRMIPFSPGMVPHKRSLDR